MKRSDAYQLIGEWLLAPNPPPAPSLACDWEMIIAAASHHKVTPGVAERLSGAGWLPFDVADYFNGVLYLNRQRNEVLLKGLADLCGVLARAGVRPLLIKGASLLASGMLHDPGARILGDLDLLLPDEKELLAAADLLLARGYAPSGQQLGKHHHLAPLIHPADGFAVELHRQVGSSRYIRGLEGDVLLEKAETIRVAGTAALVPAPADRIGIALLHGQLQDGGYHRGIPPLRMIQDIALHLRCRGTSSAYGEALTGRWGRSHRAATDSVRSVVRTLQSRGELAPSVRRALDSWWSPLLHGSLTLFTHGLPFFVSMGSQHRRSALTASRWRRRLARHFARW